ncbi:hypothetical protein [Paracoccus jeotgali]|uniref:hypothetical protein n=1 Tax=Paracoccus jeotgali TaxID=2065379 RepID=UPI0028B194C2|nr:hypothetical protein [Paracoccus jeotgali]
MFDRTLAAALILSITAVQTISSEALPVPAAGEQFWGLGSTGIYCYRAPCPWRGVFRVDPDGTRDRPLSSGDLTAPPSLRASKEDRERIENAFARDGCVVAEGHFEGETLVVKRIAGECRNWRPEQPAQ